jgi:hypothetical protein
MIPSLAWIGTFVSYKIYIRLKHKSATFKIGNPAHKFWRNRTKR